MKKRYIKPESKVLILTEKYAVLEDTVSITSSGDDGRHGNSKGKRKTDRISGGRNLYIV